MTIKGHNADLIIMNELKEVVSRIDSFEDLKELQVFLLGKKGLFKAYFMNLRGDNSEWEGFNLDERWENIKRQKLEAPLGQRKSQ